MPNTTLRLGTGEGYSDAGVIGLQDPFPTQPLDTSAIRRLVETRQCALANAAKIQDVGVPSWNDVVFAQRRIYASSRALSPNLPANLKFAYSAAGDIGYDSDGRGVAAGTTETDITGKTITGPTAANWDASRVSVAATIHLAPLAAGTTDNLVWLATTHSENGASVSYLYLRYTDANNWIRLSRPTSAIVRMEKNVASVTTTESDFACPTTEPYDGSCYALRINGTLGSVFCNGVKLGTITLSAGAQGLTGLSVGFSNLAGRGGLGELEVWSTDPPYFTK